MTQLIHNDGSASDTVIEVKLRHPGVRDRNLVSQSEFQLFVIYNKTIKLFISGT